MDSGAAVSRRKPHRPDFAQQERERERMCLRKIRYTSAKQARKQARKRSKGQRFRVYYCPWCHGHHVTTKGVT